MAHPNTYYDLLEAFRSDGCPACRLSIAAMERYFDLLDFEGITDPAVRHRIRAAHGFCRRHASQWLGQRGRVLPTAEIYRDVYAHLTDRLRDLRYEEPGVYSRLAASASARLKGGRFRALASLLDTAGRRTVLEAEAPCPACSELEREEAKLLGSLLDLVDEPSFEEAYVASAGLCLPHLKRALAAAPHQAAFQTLVDVELTRQELLIGQLDEIMRKGDPRFRGEPSGPERGAGRRAVDAATGTPRARSEDEPERVREEWLPVTRLPRRQGGETPSDPALSSPRDTGPSRYRS